MSAGGAARRSPNVVWHPSELPREERWQAIGARGASIWFTGLSGSGKSTVAVATEKKLLELGRATYVLDGDNLRHGLNGDLGFSDDDRDENVRRASEVGRLFADAGVLSLIPLVSPFRAGRDRAREIHAAAELQFFEVFIDTPIEICEQRDPKGLYKLARAGEITDFTGISSPYEPPNSPELRLTPEDGDPAAQADQVVDLLRANGVLPAN